MTRIERLKILIPIIHSLKRRDYTGHLQDFYDELKTLIDRDYVDEWIVSMKAGCTWFLYDEIELFVNGRISDIEKGNS